MIKGENKHLIDAKNVQTIADDYRKLSAKRWGMIFLGMILLLISMVIDITNGPSNLTFFDTLSVIFNPNGASVDQQVIVWDLRMPIALMAAMIGAMLGVSGAEMQTILNNPLADPFTLGISSAASFGAALAITMQIALVPYVGGVLVTANAFLMAVVASLALFIFTKMRGMSPEIMILVGIAMMFSFNALLALLQYSASETELSQIVFWMMGSLSRASWTKVSVCFAVLLICLPYFMSKSWALTALRMGDEKAASMGVNVQRIRFTTLIGVSLLASIAVSFVGVIAFVGLVGPHIARLLVGEDQRGFLPFSALAGALMMSLTSIVSKTLNPGVIYPIGIITSLIGIPFFLSLILTRRQKMWY